jgi:16S rRNA C967 or C1407 C5-methylase (RsmB/RsmF family)/NOL1/NOP2/fmu family ribosome biogenesis protein
MNLPLDFIEYTKKLLGNEWDSFLSSLSTESPISVRFNNKLQPKLKNEHVMWCDSGFYLNERPSFTFDPLFHAGTYYVQEASSMFLEQVVKQHITTPVIALDLCAAPGGKSTHLSQLLPPESLLISNEIVRSRAFVLSENIQKWGNCNNVVTNNSPSDFSSFRGLFDFILVDAPCSGEGMFRKDFDSIKEWSLKNVEMCADRQKNIIQHIWDSLKENGILVYSTCTYNQEENEKNVAWITKHFDAEILHLQTNPQWGIVENDFGYHFFPHKTKGEGFFISILQKKEQSSAIKIKHKPSQTTKINLDVLLEKDMLKIIQNNQFFYAVPDKHLEHISFLQKNLNLIHAGIPLYEQKGKDFIPLTGLTLSKYFNKENTLTHELDYESAICFLQKENFILDISHKGYIAVCHKNTPLGWIKNLGNRFNNLYPTEWRIRSKNVTKNIQYLLNV